MANRRRMELQAHCDKTGRFAVKVKIGELFLKLYFITVFRETDIHPITFFDLLYDSP